MEPGFDPFALVRPGESVSKEELERRKLELMYCSNAVSTLQEALWVGDVVQLRKCLKESGNSHIDAAGNSALHHVALNGSVEAARMLLEAGCNPEWKNREGKTPLELCKDESIRQLLLTALDSRERERQLGVLLEQGDVEGVRRALAEGVNPRAYAADNVTPLFHLAAGTGDIKLVNLMIKAGADAHALNMETRAGVLHPAARKGNVALIRRLIAVGANAMQKSNRSPASPLHVAIVNKNAAAVRVLAPCYAEDHFNVHDGVYGYPICVAVSHGGDEFVRILLDSGLDAKDWLHTQLTPQVAAAAAGLRKSVGMLLEAGFSKDARDYNGKGIRDYMPDYPL